MRSKPTALPPEALIGQADFARALARSLLADPSAAEDVAQDALAAALEAPPREQGALRGWLARVVRNFVRQRGRSEQRRSGRERSVARSERLPSVAAVLEHEAARASVVKAVLALDEPYRSAILLRFYENRAPREIAALLEVPIDTVHTRTRRALAELRARLDREFGSRSAWAALLIPFARLPLVPGAPDAPLSSPNPRRIAMNPALKFSAAGLVLVAGAVYLLRPDAHSGARPAPAPETRAAAEPAAPVDARSGALAPSQRVPLASGAVTAPPTIDPSSVAELNAATGSLHLAVTWSDGTPAEGVHANVQDVGRSDHDPLLGQTDATGACLLAGLRAGRAWVTLDRQEYWKRVEVVAGETTELAVQLEAGFDVEGVVLDENQAPVAGATVWCGQIAGGAETSFALATSAADGSFSLRACERLSSIWARADGHAPSLRRTLLDGELSPVSVTLTLPGAGASVTGRVLAPDGSPVEGAQVLVDGQDMLHAYPTTLPDGQRGYLSHSGPVRLSTDADGRFALTGVMPGTVPLGVLAPGFAAWRGSVEATAGATGDKEITLSSGFGLTGTVRNASGQPVAGRVFAFSASLSSLLSPTVMTGPDGTFAFEALAPGPVYVFVDAAEGETWTTLTGLLGDELTWDALLGPERPAKEIPVESAPWGR